MRETERLSEFSKAVRGSSLKRFRNVKPGDEEWRPRSDVLSFVDHLYHLVDSDYWFFEMLEQGSSTRDGIISPGDAKSEDWKRFLTELENLGKQKAEFLNGLSDSDLNNPVHDPVYGDTTWWWFIVRHNLDHEIHHRGQLQVLLRLKYGG